MENLNEKLIPAWKVKIGNQDLDSATYKGTLRRIIVNDTINGIGKAVLEFDAKADKNEILKSKDFELENEVEIQLGYNGKISSVFKGRITRIENNYMANKNEMVEIVCSNILYLTLNGEKNRSFKNKTKTESIKEILNLYDIKCDIEHINEDKKDDINQNHEKDFDYILSIVKDYGMYLYSKGDMKPDKTEVLIGYDLDSKIGKEHNLSLEWGHNVLSFKSYEDVENQINECVFVGTDCAKNERIEAKATFNDINLKIGKNNLKCNSKNWTTILNNSSFLSVEEAKLFAKGVLQNASMNFQKAEVLVIGNQNLFPGKRVVVKSVGAHFSGTWLVERVVHDIGESKGGFTTTVHLKRNKSGDDDNDRGSDRSVSAIVQERAASQNLENLQNNVENDDDLISEANFENYEKLVSHYEKHGAEFKCYDSVEKYLEGARYVMKTGYKVEYPYKQEVRTGYVKFLSNNHKGNAKFAFVGTNNKGFITTFHTESGKTFWKMLNGENIQIINCK